MEEEVMKNMSFMNVKKTAELFQTYNIKKIDMLSIDAEGAELSILRGIDWNNVEIHVLTIEANTHTQCMNSLVRDFLEVKANMKLHRKWKYEEVYVSNKLLRGLE